MPYELIWEDRGVIFRFWDVVSDDDLKQSNLDAYGHPRFADIAYELVDFTNVTEFGFSNDTVRLVAEWDFKASKRNPSMRLAIVGEDKLLLGLANMYRLTLDSQGGTWEQDAFATMDEARSWIADES